MTLEDIKKKYYFMKDVCFEHQNGWAVILDRFCLCLNYLFKLEENDYGFKILQIKEKFGILVIYYSFDENVPDAFNYIVKSLVDQVKDRSRIICEKCGEYGSLRSDTGWIHTYCDKCEEEYMQKIYERINKGKE